MSTDEKSHVYVHSTDMETNTARHYYVESNESLDVAKAVVEHINRRAPDGDYAFISHDDVGVKEFPPYDRSRLVEKGENKPVERLSIDPRSGTSR